MEDYLAPIKEMAGHIRKLDKTEALNLINEARKILHEVSPLKHHPIDLVLWVDAESVGANDYNPNSVAAPEMALLELSIASDGYTQPVVTFDKAGALEVVDGFHRTSVGRNSPEVKKKTMGYIPVTRILPDRGARNDRIAATIRHNRARGKHGIEAMSNIVIELARRNWSNKKIAKELGMDADEVLRLKQITGLEEMFKDTEFSQAWEINEQVLCDQQ